MVAGFRFKKKRKRVFNVESEFKYRLLFLYGSDTEEREALRPLKPVTDGDK